MSKWTWIYISKTCLNAPMFQETLGAFVSAVLMEMWTMMGGLVI